MANDLPGVSFEKVVASLQARLDPSALVKHNQFLIDRLGERRQFDVVIEGKFAGQEMLGVIECKDLRRPIGTPEVDAFVTKSADINANFKVLISRNGFSKPALRKCEHYGIQPLSLVDNDVVNRRFRLGSYWYADISYWKCLTIGLVEVEPSIGSGFDGEGVLLKGKRVLDWFTNYILDHEKDSDDPDFVLGVRANFESPQEVEVVGRGVTICTAIEFRAERALDRREKFVGISGDGFFNWKTKKATFPAGAEIVTEGVSTDFSTWDPRSEAQRPSCGFIDFQLFGKRHQFDRVDHAIDLDPL